MSSPNTNPSSGRKVMYLNSFAVTDCDCGLPLTLEQTVFDKSLYTGMCKCFKTYHLQENKFWLAADAKDVYVKITLKEYEQLKAAAKKE